MKKSLSAACVFLSAVCFATGGLFFKLIGWNPMAISSARSIIAGAVLLIFCLATRHKFVINLNVLLAAAGICATNNLYALANKMTTAGNTIVLQFTMPVFVIIIMALVFKKKPTALELTVCVAVIGGVVLFFVDSLSAGGMVGNILALVSGLTYAFFFIYNSRDNSDPFTAILLAYAMSALIGMPWLVQTDFAGTDTKTWAAVLALGFVQQAMGQLFFSLGIKGTSAVSASLISGIEPVMNPVLVAVFYHENLTPLSLVGAVLVLVSVIAYNTVTAGTPKKKELPKRDLV